MEIIGEKLKASREEKGLSLEEVSEDLNINIKDLDNVENGKRSEFSDIFLLKKYIYDYAKYLGLNYEELIEEFNEYMYEATSKIPTEVIERISKQKEKEEEEKGALSPYTIPIKEKTNKKMVIAVIVLILVVVVSISIVVIKNKARSNSELAISILM